MKIGLIVYGDIEKTSGGYLYDKKLVEHLRDSGHNVEIIGISQEDERLKNIEHNFSESLKKRIEDKELDLLLEDELCFFSLFQLNHELDQDIEIVSIVHHLSHLAERDVEKEEMYRYFESKYLESIEGFIFNSEASRRAVENLAGKTDGVIAHPGKDHFEPPESIEKNFSSNELDAVFIGNFCPHKCVDVMVRAVEGVEDVELTLIGNRYWNEGYGKEIDELISSLEVEDKVEIMGRVESGKLLEELHKADVLLLPSLYEGFGISIIEALGYGTPVIATKRGGPPEIIENGVEGFLVLPEDEEALNSRLKMLRDGPDKLKEMGERAGERFRELPEWSESMEKAEKFLCSRS